MNLNYNAEVRPYNSISSGRMKFGVIIDLETNQEGHDVDPKKTCRFFETTCSRHVLDEIPEAALADVDVKFAAWLEDVLTANDKDCIT